PPTAIPLAALCADGDESRAEHIFTAPGEGPGPTGFNLGEVGPLRSFVLGKPLQITKAVVVVSFLAIIAACLFLPAHAVGKGANTLIWNAWEPIVFGLFLIVGRMWCTVCPLSVAGRLAHRLGTLGKPPPSWLESSWVWLATLGFLAIVWSERVFHMTERPFPSGLLLLSLIVLPIGFAMVFQRETWCRYACPLGTLGAALTPASPLHLEANASVCASSCTTHDCFKGNKERGIPGCTVFHHPLNGSEAHLCKLCTDCLKSCPHDSARVYAEPPLKGVWKLGTAAWTLAPFLLAVFLLSPVLLAIQADPSLSSFFAVTAGGLLAVALGGVLTWMLPTLITGGDGEDSAIPTQVAFTLMVLAWGPLMAYQFGNISALSAFQLSSNPPSLLGQLVGTNNLTLLPVAQIFIIVFAAVLAGFILWRISVHARANEDHIAWGGWFLVLAGCAVYVGISLAIVLRAQSLSL
ncbi:MAG: 4Fe-4S binding protein, partial [Anaerolineae bacterium]